MRTLVWRMALVIPMAGCIAAASGSGDATGGPSLASGRLAAGHASAPAPALPPVNAGSFVVADAGTGAVLADRNPHGRYLPASTLKVLTAVALLPVLDPGATTVASRHAVAAEPMSAGLLVGQRYKVSDLFTALLTISANDAAIALAEATGSYGKGIAILNATAARLRAVDTHAVNPNGLDARGQFTSAYDLALIARQAVAMPAFLHYDEIHSASFPVRPGQSETLVNQNYLLTRYPGGIGGKIGWTSAANATYVGLARRNGVTLIATLMNCPSLTEITSAEKLLTWGFAADGKVAPVSMLVPPASQPALRTRGGQASGPRTATGAAAFGPRSTARASATGLRPPALVAVSFTAVTLLAIATAAVATRRRRQRPGE